MLNPSMVMKLAVLFGFRHSTRRKVYQKLSAMTGNGLGLEATLQLLHERAAEHRQLHALILQEAHSRMLTGGTLATALEGSIPEEEFMLIKSGVNSGDIPHSLELCSKLIVLKNKIKTAVQEALFEPILLLCLITLLFLIVSRVVVPQLSLITDPSTWNGAAAAMYQLSEFIDSPVGIIILTGIFALLVTVFATLPSFTGKARTVCDRIAPWSIYRLIHGAIWLFTLATLLKASIQLNNILEEGIRSSQSSPWLKERLRAVHAQLSIGKNLGRALLDAGYNFPAKDIVEDLFIYAELPGFHERLYSISEEWLEEGIERIQYTCKTLNLILKLSIGLIIGFIVLFTTTFYQQLGNIAG
ncbi:type II secretion system F family protein [Halodesulfovibrio sp.]|jgi:type II secretory pathway component PulF|uniref:type II secretion system F family protein n=1 Tax=Halodesulfovibrio sp. TaxID=1912772 RepID=UPI0025DA7BC8|nr:type II secretion system F family protein [Halodesulfovibrio sp.]MCT4625661.1 type II secretion system F family protein [Halodesulfovibrio sp.]